VLPAGRWIRIYPVPFRTLPEFRQFAKYARMRVDLKPPSRDRRSESYALASNLEVIGHLYTARGGAARKAAVLRTVHEAGATVPGGGAARPPSLRKLP